MANKLYEEQHIQNIANAIRGKTGKTDSLLVSAMAEEIEGITTKSDPILQDKTVTENGEYSADEGYDGLGKITVEVVEDLTNLVDLLGDGEVIEGGVPGSGGSGSLEGLENGYDVMFYDENNEGLAFYSIKQGQVINAPIYVCSAWQKSDGTVVTFPFEPTEDLILYAIDETVIGSLYKYYGIDISTYPYVTMCLDTSSRICLIIFGDRISTINSDKIEFYNSVVSEWTNWSSEDILDDYSDIASASRVIQKYISSDSLITKEKGNVWPAKNSSYIKIYSNYDTTGFNTSFTYYRLDQ